MAVLGSARREAAALRRPPPPQLSHRARSCGRRDRYRWSSPPQDRRQQLRCLCRLGSHPRIIASVFLSSLTRPFREAHSICVTCFRFAPTVVPGRVCSGYCIILKFSAGGLSYRFDVVPDYRIRVYQMDLEHMRYWAAQHAQSLSDFRSSERTDPRLSGPLPVVDRRVQAPRAEPIEVDRHQVAGLFCLARFYPPSGCPLLTYWHASHSGSSIAHIWGPALAACVPPASTAFNVPAPSSVDFSVAVAPSDRR